MELRQRVRASPLYFGKKSPDDPDALSFWCVSRCLCLPRCGAVRCVFGAILTK
jgi:hypothetical protein